MNELLTPILSFLLLYKYAALFAIVLASNIIFFLPSSVFILMAGVFSGAAYFNFYWSLFIVVAANTLGDFLIYRLARKYPSWLNQVLRQKNTVALESLKKFMKSTSALTIIISRISGSSAIVVNILSGLAFISWPKFLLYDLIGNFLVAGLLLYLGFIVGSDWEDLYHTINIITLTLAILMIAFLAYKGLSRSKS